MMPLILSAALKGTAVLAFAWLATTLLRKSSADLRHRIWLAALVCLPLFMIPFRVPQAVQMNVTFTATSLSTTTQSRFPWIYVWAAGASLLLARFAWNLFRLQRITRKADGSDIRISHEIASPITWGIFRPVILLPSYASDWTYAIQHERVHISRADWLSQSFAQIVTAVFWFNPLVWFAASRLRLEAEHAVDDAVLSSGAEATAYAQQLLEVARYMNHASPVAAVAMVSRPVLSTRIAAILDAARPRTRTGRYTRIAVVIVVLCIAPLLAAFQATPIPIQIPQAPFAQPTVPAPPVIPSAPVFVAQATPQPAGLPSKPVPATPPEPVTQQSPATAPETPAEPYKIGDGVSAPALITRAEPLYTPEARDAKIEGEVWISAVIDAAGVPAEVTITRSLDAGLDAQAIEAVQAWRFKPGMKDGVPVAVRATISVSFHLL